MEQIFFTDYLQKYFSMCVNSKSGKPLKAIIERTRMAEVSPVSFWGQVKLLYRVYRKVELEVRVKVILWLHLHRQADDQPPELQGD